jgi:hypothetical protein
VRSCASVAETRAEPSRLTVGASVTSKSFWREARPGSSPSRITSCERSTAESRLQAHAYKAEVCGGCGGWWVVVERISLPWKAWNASSSALAMLCRSEVSVCVCGRRLSRRVVCVVCRVSCAVCRVVGRVVCRWSCYLTLCCVCTSVVLLGHPHQLRQQDFVTNGAQ